MARPTECVLLADDLAQLATSRTMQDAICPNGTRADVSPALSRAASTVARALDSRLGLRGDSPKVFVGCLSGRDDVRQYERPIDLGALPCGSFTFVDEATGTVLCTVVRYANPRMPLGMLSSAQHESEYGLVVTAAKTLSPSDVQAVSSYEEPVTANRKPRANPEGLKRRAARIVPILDDDGDDFSATDATEE